MTSTTPGFLMWPMLVIVLFVTIGRALMLPAYAGSRQSLQQRRISITLIFASGVVVTRVREFQDFLAPHLTDITIIRPITHTFAMLAGISIFGIVAAWSPPEPKWRQPVLYFMVVVFGAAMIALSQPARDRGLKLEEFGGWQCMVYHLLYASMLLVGFGAAMLQCFRDLRTPQDRRSQLIAAAIMLAASVSVFDNLFRPFAAIFQSLHIENWITELRGQMNDVLYLPGLTITAIAVSRPLFQPLFDRIGFNPDAHQVKALEPMWTGLTAATPEVVLDPDGYKGSSTRKLHRMVVEIRDSLLILTKYAVPEVSSALTASLDSRNPNESDRALILRNIDLMLAGQARSAGRSPGDGDRPQAVLPGLAEAADFNDEIGALRPLAEQWSVAADVLAEAGAVDIDPAPLTVGPI
jgi:hypothetical protein